MIVFSQEQYLVLIPNTMVLEKNGNYFYIEKSLYDNLVVLKHAYEFERIGELIGKENNVETIEWLREELPAPLDSLAPFLRLVSREIGEDLELCVGSLHEIFCTGLNPHGFLKTPLEMRRDIEFGRTGSIYPEMWKGIMQQFRDFNEVMEAIDYRYSRPTVAYHQNEPQYNYTNNSQEVEEEVESIGGFSMVGGQLLFEDDESDEIEELDLSVVTEVTSTYKAPESVISTDEDEAKAEEVRKLEKALRGEI